MNAPARRINIMDCLREEAPPEEEIVANEAAARALGLPDVATLPRPAIPRLAIVGGGHSIERRVHALRTWRGDVWALNHAALWCVRQRIRCTLYTIDATDKFDPALSAVRRAILPTRCHPRLFEILRGRDVHTFELPRADLGPGSAATATMLAARLGYREITFFGCEGDVEPGAHHAYAQVDGAEGREIVVACDGRRFLTRPDFVLFTEAIALLVRNHAGMHERSGGLLAALVRDPVYEVVGVSPALATAATRPELIEGYARFVGAGQ